MTKTQNELVGREWHTLRNTKYMGTFRIDEIVGVEGEWLRVRDGKVEWSVRAVDCFETEAEARTEAKARRRPRQQRQPVALYGDYAQLAAISGITTDGTGRRAR